MKTRIVLLALSLTVSLAAHAAEWNQWRGPNRDGTAPDAKLPTKWPAAFPAPKWKSMVGIGYSAPVISGGKVFVMGREEDKREVCLAFDASTGKPLWRQAYVSTYAPPDPTAGKGPNSTPTVDKDRVYMLGLGGMFHCLDVNTGKILWKHDLAKEYWGVVKDKLGEDAWRPPCGASASALVEGNAVILPVGGRKAGAFTAFDRNTGKLLWKALTDRSSYASPLLGTLAGTPQVVGFTGTRMVGIHDKDHSLLWEYPFTAMYEQTIVSPVVWNNHVIVCGEAKPTNAIQIVKESSKITQKPAWQNADLSAYLSTPIVFKDHLLGFAQRGSRLVCVELATGKTTWTSPRMGKLFVSLVVAGDQILAMSDSGKLHVLAANPKEFTQIGEWQLAEPGTVWSHLAVVGNRLYVKDKEHLSCYELGA